MATATKTRSRKPRKAQVHIPLLPDQNQEAGSAQTCHPLTQISRDQEPLETAVRRQEAPEAWHERLSERAGRRRSIGVLGARDIHPRPEYELNVQVGFPDNKAHLIAHSPLNSSSTESNVTWPELEGA